jgi:aminoglycoside/choline kinase family phosphotransferase
MTAGPLPRDRATLADAGVAPVANTGELTVDWFRRVLASAGLLSEADLSAVELQPVSGGLMACTVRATLRYAAPTSSPDSLLVKFPTDDAGSLGVAQAMGMYELETRFYQDIAPLVPEVGLPACYLAELSDNAKNFTLVLEDLGSDLRAGDVLSPSTVDKCSRALRELAKFQAPLWNSSTVSRLGWIADPMRTIGVFDAVPNGLQPFLTRFGDQLDATHVKLFERVIPRAGDWVRRWKAPTVVQHGDFRSDNIMFSTIPANQRVAVIDFQTVRLGPPGVDPAYYLGSALPTADRRGAERELIAEYHDQLLRGGVEGFDFNACWDNYREGAMYGVLLFVGMAGQVASTERGDRLIVDQIRRYADMALDLDAPTAADLM